MRAYIEQYIRTLRSVTDIPTRTFCFFAATQIPSGKQLLFLTHILAINVRIWIAFRKSQCRVCIKNVMNVPTRTFCFVAATYTPQGKNLLFLTRILAISIRMWIILRESKHGVMLCM